MLHTEGIVLRTVKYGETSLIAEVLTLEKGLQSFIIGGVRTARGGRKKSISQLMSIIDIVSYYSEHKTLHRVKEVGYHYLYRHLPFDLVKRSVGLFLLEMVRNTIIGSEYEPGMYHFIKKQYIYLDMQEKVPATFPLVFMLDFTRYLGFYPGPYHGQDDYFDLRNGIFTSSVPDHVEYVLPPTAEALDKLRTIDPSTPNPYFNRQVRDDLITLLLDYYAIQIDHFKMPVSLSILKELLHGPDRS